MIVGPLDAELRAQFAAEQAYALIGLELLVLSHGECLTATPVRDALLNHASVVQGGIVAMIADATAGYAALTMTGEGGGEDMTTIEFKTSFYRPALGLRLLCHADAMAAGASIVFCRSRVYSDVETAGSLIGEATLTFKRRRGAAAALGRGASS